MLVTHDRYLLDTVSTVVVGLDGQGGAGQFADYSQWEAWVREGREAKSAKKEKPAAVEQQPSGTKKKLSYMEAREYATIEERIAEAEATLLLRREAFHDPAIASDGERLVSAQAELEAAQQQVDTLIARWAELEEKGDRD